MFATLARIAAKAAKAAPSVFRSVTSSRKGTIAVGAVAIDAVALPTLNEATGGKVPSPELTATAAGQAAESLGKILAGVQLGLVEGAAEATFNSVDEATGGNGTLVLIGAGLVLAVVLLKR